MDNRFFLAKPLFGDSTESIIGQNEAEKTIRAQERLLKNLSFFIKSADDKYNLLSDKSFVSIMSRMISTKVFLRPNIIEVINS